MLKFTTIASIIAITSALAAPTFSYAAQDKLEAAFKKADKDNDGTLDKEEAKAMPRVAKHFSKIDSDNDGTVSLDEIKASAKQGGKSMHDKGEHAFKKADKDNDGTLDKEEAKGMPRVAKNFDAIDTDKDGTVSMEEIHTFMKAHRMKGKE
jgi:Ca2+-binding EF-hand superfamily protein